MATSFRVRVEPGGATFSVRPGETVLDAALREGVPLRYGCRQGSCSSCKYFLSQGDVDFGRASTFALSREEREEGFALLCCAVPLEDLEIEAEEGDDARSLPVLTPTETMTRVASVEARTETLWRLSLEPDQPIAFYPGQYVELGVPGAASAWRAYSIANPPSDEGRLDFLMKRLPNGAFSGQLDRLSAGAEIPLRGPFGQSYLREGDRSVLLVGVGSGLAPLLSILADAAEREDRRSFTLFYGARTRADLPYEAELADFGRRIDLDYRPCLSQPTEACGWDGIVGRVTQAIQRELPDASALDAYLCGAPAMCDDVTRLLEAKGIGDGCVFCDPFHPAEPR